MGAFWKRLRLWLADGLRYSPLVRGGLCRWQLLRDTLARPHSSQRLARSVARLCGAARLATTDASMVRIEARIRQHAERLRWEEVNWEGLVPRIRDANLSKAVLLKPRVSEREKGVVFVSFEDQWMKLLAHCDLERFAQRYTLVVSPTWCPPHSVVNCLFPLAYTGPIFSLISNHRDLTLFPRLSHKYRMVPLYASSWVNPAFYTPLPHDRRDLDVVMVANFGTYKRHHVLFRALRELPSHVRATLVGQAQGGRTADTLRAEARAFGVEQRVTVLSSVTNETLADCLARAKVSVILSRREGSCVAVVESMFADTPVVLLQGAEVGSAAFITPATGTLVPERRLAEGILNTIQRRNTFAPRRWAMANVSCHRSSATLNSFLRDAALADGQQWTRDVATLCWRPDPQLVEPECAPGLREEWEWARAHLGVELGPPPVAEPSLPLPQLVAARAG